MKEQHRNSMKEDKYNLTLARSRNVCSKGKATTHYVYCWATLRRQQTLIVAKNAFVANLYRRQE